MKNINVKIEGCSLDFSLARQIGECIANRDEELSSLVSWCDNLAQKHSPQCLHCEIKGEPGWEVYGRNHGGRLRISFNTNEIVLIFS